MTQTNKTQTHTHKRWLETSHDLGIVLMVPDNGFETVSVPSTRQDIMQYQGQLWKPLAHETGSAIAWHFNRSSAHLTQRHSLPCRQKEGHERHSKMPLC